MPKTEVAATVGGSASVRKVAARPEILEMGLAPESQRTRWRLTRAAGLMFLLKQGNPNQHIAKNGTELRTTPPGGGADVDIARRVCPCLLGWWGRRGEHGGAGGGSKASAADAGHAGLSPNLGIQTGVRGRWGAYGSRRWYVAGGRKRRAGGRRRGHGGGGI